MSRQRSVMERLLGRSPQAQSLSENPQGFRIRKLADMQPGEQRVKMWDPETGEAFLVNPRTGQPEPWPLLGVTFEVPPPPSVTVPTSFIDNGVAEGWITVENERYVHRPGGPADNPWKVTHTFRHVDSFTVHAVEGDVSYKVVHQPDKHEADEATGLGGRVDWFYLGEKQNG